MLPQRASSAAAALPRLVPPPVTRATRPSSRPSAKTCEASTPLFPHHLYDETLGAAAIELAVEDLLPRPEVQSPLGDRHHHLVVDEQILEMRVAVVLAATVVAVVARVGQQIAGDLPVGLLPTRRGDLV